MTLWHALTVGAIVSFGAVVVLLIAVMRQVGSILMVVGTSTPLSIPAGPKIGAVLPVPGSQLRRPLLVVFVSPDCTQCGNIVPGFGRLAAAYRDQLQLPEELGLVIEIKRSNYKVLYPNDKRCWLPRDAIACVRPEQLDYSGFLERLHYLIKKVHALECELVSGDEGHRLTLRIDSINHETMDELRAFLADKFVFLTVVPEGMAFMQLELRFR